MTDNGVIPAAEILDGQQCWTLLRETSIGRLAVIVDGRPDVFPVNYQVDQQTLVFKTGGGTKFAALDGDAPVALEVDAVSAQFGTAWSVVVKGHAVTTSSEDKALRIIGRNLFPWQGIGKDYFITIVPETVTGRRFTLTAPMRWRTPVDDATRAGIK